MQGESSLSFRSREEKGEAIMPDVADWQARIDALERCLEEETGRFKRLVHVATQLNSTLNLGDLLQLIMTSAAQLLGAETASLLLLDEETHELVFEVVVGGPASHLAKHRLSRGEGIAGWALDRREPVLVEDPRQDQRFSSQIEELTGFKTRNLLAVPLLVKERAIGVIEVLNKVADSGFDTVDLEVAQVLASFAAVAIDNASLYARLADAVVAARMSYRL
jgi:GAF domain-containing protein